MEYCFTLRFSLPEGHAPVDELLEHWQYQAVMMH